MTIWPLACQAFCSRRRASTPAPDCISHRRWRHGWFPFCTLKALGTKLKSPALIASAGLLFNQWSLGQWTTAPQEKAGNGSKTRKSIELMAHSSKWTTSSEPKTGRKSRKSIEPVVHSDRSGPLARQVQGRFHKIPSPSWAKPKPGPLPPHQPHHTKRTGRNPSPLPLVLGGWYGDVCFNLSSQLLHFFMRSALGTDREAILARCHLDGSHPACVFKTCT